jgi:hypothetical protein
MWFGLVAMFLEVVQSSSYCSPNGGAPGQGLHFTDKPNPATLEITCTDQVTDLVCCATGYTSMSWYQKQDGEWRSFKDDAGKESNRRYLEGNQTARIERTSLVNDSGSFKCVASDGNDRIENTVRMDIRNCTNFNKPPDPILPVDNTTHLEASIGGNVSIMCQGFVGDSCMSADDRLLCGIGWRMQWNDSMFPIAIDEDRNSTIYCVSQLDPSNMTLSSLLVISNVTREDFAVVFECWMSNNVDPTHYNKKVILKMPVEPSKLWTAPFRRGLFVGGVALAFVIISALIVRDRIVDVKLCLKETHPRAAEEDYDVFLVNDRDDNMVLMRAIDQHLNERSFKVCTSQDIQPGRSRIEYYNEMVDKSAKISVILSSNPPDEEILRVLREVIASQHTKLFFILDSISSVDEVFAILGDDYNSVRQAVKQCTKIHWKNGIGEHNFWKRIYLILPTPTTGNDQQI